MLQPHLEALDACLEQQVEKFEPEIREHVSYSIDTGGKRIRPSLIFFSGWNSEGSVDKNLVQLAAVVETVHLATLVHDDIMDEADIRRNRATVAKKYNNATAVLLGDALFSHAVYLATQFPTNEVCREIAVSMRQVCTGEILQTMQRGDPDLDMETYFRVIDLKTAELFRVSCHLGAMLAGFDRSYIEAAAAFGRHLGIAYQIYDDMTDLFGSQEKIGKTLGTDIATGKPTMPIILMRDRLPESEAQELRETLAGKIEADVPRWLEKLKEMGIFEEVRQAIFEEIRKGREAIEHFEDNPSSLHLRTISQLLWNQVAAL
ncbi:polyprenyl synthetase family protein [Pelagicoccus albus]|uniref:Polyprenyl synthetase family protein n=1 Tax=Pelagicoccus albus TaxID=415222 RepID=A0A7X1B6Z6_9BACT|nr:polyprenyl synthetase family protein [Pelagicoccus albus]MBC2606833.1 polyprenyl synthetase family protein [Pelagicoccus albus]